MDDLSAQLRGFVDEHRAEILSDPTRSTNRLRDLLGVWPELSVSDSRALVTLVTDGSVADWVRAGHVPAAAVSDGPASWASGIWSVAITQPAVDTPASWSPPSAVVPSAVVPPAVVPPARPVASAAPEVPARPPRRWMAAAVVGIVAAVLVAVVLVIAGGDDAADTDATAVSVTTPTFGTAPITDAPESGTLSSTVPVESSLTFDPQQLGDDVAASRVWSVSGVQFTSEVTITNSGAAPATVVYDEVVPEEIAGSLASVTFEPAYTSVVPEVSIVRYALNLDPSGSTTIRYTVTLPAALTAGQLNTWRGAWMTQHAAHLADPLTSPVDRDHDGVPDAQDTTCADTAGVIALGGCPDADSDGVPEPPDACPGQPGELGGCLDADGDTFADTTGADLCAGSAGAVQGCPDVDLDGAADVAGTDDCIGVLGAVLGCPDDDGDGVANAGDLCPTRSGGGDPSGCGDTDGDGARDDADYCPDERGALGGCPDSDGDGVANGGDACPREAAPGSSNGCPDRDKDDDGVLDSVDQCATTKGSSSYHGCPSPSVSIGGQRQVCNGQSTFPAAGSNATFVRWNNGSTANPGTFTFTAGTQTLVAYFTTLDGQTVSATATIDVQQCTI